MRVLSITSPDNPRIKDLIRLKQRRYRDRKELFLVEGAKEIAMALDAGVRLEGLYFCKDFFRQDEDNVLEVASGKGVRLYSLTLNLFDKVSYREGPDGLLAVAVSFKATLGDIKLKNIPILVVVEALEKPGNLGAILRCADAVGAQAMIVCDPVTDIFNPNVVRASRGTLFSVPVINTSTEETIRWLKDRGIKIMATTPRKGTDYVEVDYCQPCAIVVGSEHPGLSRNWIEQADFRVRIPMLGKANSLNVATAAAVIFYEALRQRRYKGSR